MISTWHFVANLVHMWGGELLFEVIVEDDLIQIKKRGTYVMFSEGGGWGGETLF